MARQLRLLLGMVLLPIGIAGCTSQQPLAPAPVATADLPPTTASAGAQSVSPSRFGGRGTPGVVFVTSQGLYYDTFVVTDPLPMEGSFQKLTSGQTQFGPGQPGYLGGRWWEDLNGNGIQDSGHHFFLCPLLPPGRATP